MSKWKPIDTAPKDGTEVIGWGPSWDKPSLMEWDTLRNRGWRNLSNGEKNPTHWMPLPEPPKE